MTGGTTRFSPCLRSHPGEGRDPILNVNKARTRKEAKTLTDIPNVGPAMVADFKLLGVRAPADLAGKDPQKLYDALCRKTGVRQDPCVLDTFMAAVDFMNGAPARPWWHYTPKRKKLSKERRA